LLGRDRVASLSEIEKKLAGQGRRPPYARALAAFLRGLGIRSADVPANFPLGLARQLENEGLRLHPADGLFLPERQFKTREELRSLRCACAAAEAAMARAFEVLRAAAISKNRALRFGGRPLTAEVLRLEVQMALLRAGAESRGEEIIACGEQACDPHERGSGPLLAHELIILDIFPRHSATGFYGDITRTVVRGRASEEQRRLWHTCLDGQRQALAELKAGADGTLLQNRVREFFERSGYPTGQHGGRWRGFFHGLGHGLGREVHEAPRIAGTRLAAGHVVTVEPGIYWPGVGGVRHEDVAVITRGGHRLLTRFPKPLEI
ncbi:MAG: Xaa-Pro peptidase family protein, partial [Terrimicrobiaceae bacterium]|nr:Xaa-Pro peptidase family protein [Terrimicrobiaceae bacterium]